ncbi:MAG: acetyltransferase [Bryobacteraceae bacterium]|nr:acetyltransferase [Bryobacteraceae bacterium]MDW8379686.1 acetyltransferase [Bryobacterales bacterium]
MAEGQNPAVELRALATIDEFDQAVKLQKEIWGFDDIELLPRRLFVVANKIGGQTFGAYDGDRMVAFLLAIPGLKKDFGYLHSHMLGVLAGYRDRGIGRMLKLKQREDALARGIQLVEWTFDPLELRNAYFNIEKLGAVVRRYVLNQYGMTSSHLHTGLPTDRCVAEWWLDHPRVHAVLQGNNPDRERAIARICVPANIAELRRKDVQHARAIQESVSNQFLEHFRAGLAVVGMERSSETAAYLLGPWQ